jgi:FMNH2-dependent dimethyl sulfone monooxygenase
MQERRAALGLPTIAIGSAAFVVVRDTQEDAERELRRMTDVRQSARGYANYEEWSANTPLEQRVSLEDYAVSNRGLRARLVGTPTDVASRIGAFARAGVDLLLLQFRPQYEEMERFAEQVMPLVASRPGSGPPLASSTKRA